MEKKKKVKFDYVRVYSYIGDLKNGSAKEPKPFKLEELLKLAVKKSVKERTTTYYGEEITLQSVEKDEECGFWKLQIVRERIAEVPGIINKDKSEFKPLDLEDDEYIGEEVSALYYEKTHVLMIQRNRNALGIKGIQAYFNNVLRDKDNLIEFKLVPFTTNIKELRKLNLRKIEISFAEVKENSLDNKEDSSLISVIRSANKAKSFSTKVSFSVGRGRKEKSLSPEEIENFISLTKEDGFKKIHLEYKVDEDSPLEIVELINGSLVDESIMEYSKENRIEYNRVSVIMVDLFKQRLTYLTRTFTPKK